MGQHKILWIGLISSLFFSCSFSEENEETGNNNQPITEIKKDSIHYEYYDNGELKSKSTYVNSVRDGLYESYWYNGNVYGRVMYENGARSGFFENFDSTSQKLLRRVEYIKDPTLPINSRGVDYANRMWYYIDGDTMILSKSTTDYEVINSSNTGFKLISYFSTEDSKDGVFDNYLFVKGNITKPDTAIKMKTYKKDQQSIDYVFSKEDIKKGYVEGAIVADDIYEKEGKKYSSSRILFFRWNIKEAKLENHLIGN